MKKLLVLIISVTILLSSCAQTSMLVIDDKPTLVKPYGWVNKTAQKNDSVNYELSAGSIIFSVLFVNTLIVPIWLTGWKLYSPVDVKSQKLEPKE